MEIRFLFSKTYDFLFALDDISVARINKSLGLLEKYGNTVSYPHTKPAEYLNFASWESNR